MRSLLLVLAMLACTSAFAQYGFEVSKDKENGDVVYRGSITFDNLKEQLSFHWMEDGVKEYKPDTVSIKFLQKNLPGYQLTIFLGTWCSDSKEMIPKLYKVLTEVHYPLSQCLMYGVDRDKTAPGDVQKLYNLTNVPTIIVYKKNHEVGRIVETVKKSIEKDLQAIIERDLKH